MVKATLSTSIKTRHHKDLPTTGSGFKAKSKGGIVKLSLGLSKTASRSGYIKEGFHQKIEYTL